ncbi:hypothetical protein C5167_042137, partial [Papaver somniferum]
TIDYIIPTYSFISELRSAASSSLLRFTATTSSAPPSPLLLLICILMIHNNKVNNTSKGRKFTAAWRYTYALNPLWYYYTCCF